MDAEKLAEIATWITEEGLAGRTETEMLTGFCERLIAAGVPLARSLLIIDTLHPIYEGRAVRWTTGEAPELIEYGSSDEGEMAESWRRSTFYRLFETGETMLRRRIDDAAMSEFPGLRSEFEAGRTDYVCFCTHFGAEGTIGDADCIYSNWTTARDRGFDDADIEVIRRLLPHLTLAMKCASLGRITETLAETYLGRDAGRMVLSGRIGRGVADRIDAAVWFSDLQGFTRITDTAAPEQIIPLLNDYAEVVVSTVHEHGGDVLKLIGDGVLAIFRADDRQAACLAAINAASLAKRRVRDLNERRSAEGQPTTKMYLGLHVGEVFFGNIGSHDRLDFTVVGPAVNEVSRIAAMCRSAEQLVLVSTSFCKALGSAGPGLVSVGRYALRGVGQPQELFTIDTGTIDTSAPAS